MNKGPLEEYHHQHTHIPRVFQSDAKGGYLDRCIGCDLDLLETNSDYMIEKAFKSYRGLESYSTIFEYAMCLNCVNKMHNTLSEESRVNISTYFQEHAQIPTRVMTSSGTDILPWLDRCILTNQKAIDIPEFQIYGHCQGENMILDGYPFMISGKATDDLIELISDKTLDELQNFTDQLIGGPSEFIDILKTRPTILL